MRLIDADVLNIRSYCRWFDNPDDVRVVERMIREAPTVIPPPNPPLTLEELREMDGEPVWIECLFNENLSSYVVIDRCDNGIFTKLFYADFEYHNNEWLAYRRKPEEGKAGG